MNEIYSDSSYVFISKFVPKIPVPISPSIPKSRIPEANDPESRKSGFGTGISGLSGFPISRPSNTTGRRSLKRLNMFAPTSIIDIGS